MLSKIKRHIVGNQWSMTLSGLCFIFIVFISQIFFVIFNKKVKKVITGNATAVAWHSMAVQPHPPSYHPTQPVKLLNSKFWSLNISCSIFHHSIFRAQFLRACLEQCKFCRTILGGNETRSGYMRYIPVMHADVPACTTCRHGLYRLTANPSCLHQHTS